MIMILKDTSSLSSMGGFCMTKWFRFSEILTILDRHHYKVKDKGDPLEKLRYINIKKKYLGKLIFGKARQVGLWYQHQGEITNLNVFG